MNATMHSVAVGQTDGLTDDIMMPTDDHTAQQYDLPKALKSKRYIVRRSALLFLLLKVHKPYA